MKPTIFQELVAAIHACQGSKGNLRTIVAPLFGDENLMVEFHRDAEADPDGFSMIETAFMRADLNMRKEFPGFDPDELSYRTEDTSGAPAVVVDVPVALKPGEIQAMQAASVNLDSGPTMNGDTDPTATGKDVVSQFAAINTDPILADLVKHPQG